MANYASVRGWLECDYEQVSKIKEIINLSNQDKEYKNKYDECWSFPCGGANWVVYIFFGCDLKLYRMDYLDTILHQIRETIEDVDGYFKIDGEEDEDHWIINISSDKSKPTLQKTHLNPDRKHFNLNHPPHIRKRK